MSYTHIDDYMSADLDDRLPRYQRLRDDLAALKLYGMAAPRLIQLGQLGSLATDTLVGRL